MGNNQKIKFVEKICRLDQENLVSEAWSYEAWDLFFQKAKVHYCNLSDEIIEEIEIRKIQDEPRACYMEVTEEDTKIALATALKTEGTQNQDEIYIFLKGDSQEVIAIIAASIIDDLIELLKIFVIKTERKKGLGKKILNFWLASQKKINNKKVILEHRAGNELAERLYKGAGFHFLCLRKNFYENPREDAKTYEYRLSHLTKPS